MYFLKLALSFVLLESYSRVSNVISSNLHDPSLRKAKALLELPECHVSVVNQIQDSLPILWKLRALGAFQLDEMGLLGIRPPSYRPMQPMRRWSRRRPMVMLDLAHEVVNARLPVVQLLFFSLFLFSLVLQMKGSSQLGNGAYFVIVNQGLRFALSGSAIVGLSRVIYLNGLRAHALSLSEVSLKVLNKLLVDRLHPDISEGEVLSCYQVRAKVVELVRPLLFFFVAFVFCFYRAERPLSSGELVCSLKVALH